MTQSPSQLQVLNKSQAGRVDRVHTYHNGCIRSFGEQMGYAYLAGAELLALKDETPHGQFEALKEAQFSDISRTSLGRYMQFTQAIQDKYPTVGYLSPDKLLTNGQFDQKQQEKVLKAVHEVADGKTLTQLYRDLGVIRDKKPAQHHPRKSLNPDEELTALKEQARSLMAQYITCCNLLPNVWEHFSNDERSQVEDARLGLGQFIKANSKKKS